jgi:superfamily II DNA or RNA helicase
MPQAAPAYIKVVAGSSPAHLDRFASERSIRLEWTIEDSFIDLCARFGLTRRGDTAWSASAEDDNQMNLVAFIAELNRLYGPHIIQASNFYPLNNANADTTAVRYSLSRSIFGSQHYYTRFMGAMWPDHGSTEHTRTMRSLVRISVKRERQGGIWFRLHTGFECEDRDEFEALTYPRMHGLTKPMRRASYLTPLEAIDVLTTWTGRGRGANVVMADDVRAAFDAVSRGVVVGYQTGAPALAVIRAGRKIKGAPTPKSERSITLKRIISMREKNPDVTFYVHPSLDDIIAMNAAKPHEDERLRPYQQEAVGLHLATSIGYLQACDTGGGKTVMQLAAMRERAKDIDNHRGLIVCEANMREPWGEEGTKWFPEATICFVKRATDVEKVADALSVEGPVVIVTSYTFVANAYDEAERRAKLLDLEAEIEDADLEENLLGALLLDTRWHDACADEAVSVRNNSSKQSKALWAIRENIDVATALTATPRNKSHDDIGNLLSWVRNDRHLFVGDTKLSLCYSDDDMEDAKRLFDTLGPLIFRRDSSEFANELPEAHPVVELLQPTAAEKMLAHAAEVELKRIYFELVEALEHAERMGNADPEQLAEAKQALREAHGAWLGGTTLARMTMSDPVSILGSESVGAKLLIAQGLVQAAIDSNPSKRARFLADVTERVGRGEQVLVFTSYATVANLLVKHLQDAGITAAPFTGKNLSSRNRHRVDFQEGNIDVLVATSAGSRGLTLTAATTVIHYDLPWTIEQVIQRTGRIVRFGSAHERVDIVFYVLQGTIEERIAAHLMANGRAASMVLDGARGVDTSQSTLMQALGGLIKSGTIKVKKTKGIKGEVELGRMILQVED